MGVLLLLSTTVVFGPMGAMAENKVEISWLEWWEGEWGKDFMREVINQFESKNPNIKVTRESITFPPMHDKVITLFEAKQLPDVIGMIPEWYGEFASMGILEPLDPFIEREPAGFMEQYVSSMMPEWEGKHYVLPLYAGCSGILYNKEMFAVAGVKPAENWEEFISIAKRLTKPEKFQYAIDASLVTAPPDFVWYGFFPWLIAAGGIHIENGRAAFNSPAGVKVLEFWKDLIYKHQVVAPGYAVNGYMELREHFAAGQTAMLLDGPWGVPIVTGRNPKLELGAFPIPKDVRSGANTGGGMLSITTQSKNKKESWEFIKFMASEKINYKMAKHLRLLPVVKANYGKPFITEDPVLSVFAKIQKDPNTIPVGATPQYIPLAKYVQVAMQKVIVGKESAKKALDEAAAKWNEVLKRYYK